MNTQEQQAFEKKALDQLLSGKSLFGKDGAFAPMLKGFIEKALEVEMSSHLTDTPEKNKRNGKGKKTLKTNIGEIEIATPTDRNSSFEPSIVKKRQRILADNLSEKIIFLMNMDKKKRTKIINKTYKYSQKFYFKNIKHKWVSLISK